MKRLTSLILAVMMLTAPLVACKSTNSVGRDVNETPSPAMRIVINELMADNSAFVMGCTDDWIELYNDEDEEALLNGYYLSKNEDGSDPFTLDERTIPSKGYLTVRLTEDSAFRLSKDGDTVYLFCATGLIDTLAYDSTIGEKSFSHEGLCATPTPGYPNTAAGAEEYASSTPLPGVRINEVVPSNEKFLPVGEDFYDLVEIYNGSGAAVNLADYWLSDKRSEPKRCHLPDITLPDGGYYVIYCSGLEEEGHAPFKISSLGETIYLSDNDGFVDAVSVPGDVPKNESFGRNDRQLVYMKDVTMGAENALGEAVAPMAITASVASGAYDSPVTVELSGEGTIYYTLDGTAPNESSNVYTEPLTVTDVATIRAFAAKDGRTSGFVSFCYIINKDHKYPVVNVAIRQDYLTGDEGVLNHVDPEYEHEAFVTMMDGSREMFAVPCGFKLHGNDSKKGDKQNFQLRFRSEYGLSELDYKVFENRDYTSFNSLLLKGGSEDFVSCNFRDELCADLADGATALATQAFRPVILYLNGQYWGFYWLRERYDARNLANRLDVSKGSITQLKSYGFAAVDGTTEEYQALVGYCRTHDLRNDDDYKYVMDRVDAKSIMDWYICRSYMSDADLANIRFFKSSDDDGRWHWCFFDLDWSFWIDQTDPIGNTARDDGYHDIILALFRNPEFRDMFLKRYAELMNTVLNEETILAKIDWFVETMRPEIEADRERWDLSVSYWEANVERLRDFVRDGKRDATVLTGLKNYFGLSSEQMTSYFGDKW